MSLVIEHQVGLFQLVGDFQPDEYRNNILAHAALGKVFCRKNPKKDIKSY